MGPRTDGTPRIIKSELPTTPELRGWSLGLTGRPGFYNQNFPRGWSLALMGRPGFQYQNFLSLTNSEGGVWD